MAAVRYRTYIQLYASSQEHQRVKFLNLESRDGISAFYNRYFPISVHNTRGTIEFTLRYILRHTQLLPRQLIGYLNSIAQVSMKRNTGGQPFFDQESIVEGVRQYEHTVCEGIFSGFRTVYPNARDICAALLPNLTMEFSLGDFQRLFRQMRGPLRDFESHAELLSLLIEIGAVGVVEKPTASGYLTAQFAYDLPYELHYRLDDKFCIHPVFLAEFRVRPAEGGYRPIAPKGALWEASDVS